MTLAVFAALASIAVPQFASLLGDRGLVRAGDQVQIAMLRLRVEAMREGRVMMIEGNNETGEMRIRPYFSMSDSTETLDQTGSQSALLTGADQATIMPMTETEVETRAIELPENVRFSGVMVASAARSMMIQQDQQTEMMGEWGSPVLFYPDGTTSTARVTLLHSDIGTINVDLRGVTGDVTVGGINVDQSLVEANK